MKPFPAKNSGTRPKPGFGVAQTVGGASASTKPAPGSIYNPNPRVGGNNGGNLKQNRVAQPGSGMNSPSNKRQRLNNANQQQNTNTGFLGKPSYNSANAMNATFGTSTSSTNNARFKAPPQTQSFAQTNMLNARQGLPVNQARTAANLGNNSAKKRPLPGMSPR